MTVLYCKLSFLFFTILPSGDSELKVCILSTGSSLIDVFQHGGPEPHRAFTSRGKPELWAHTPQRWGRSWAPWCSCQWCSWHLKSTGRTPVLHSPPATPLCTERGGGAESGDTSPWALGSCGMLGSQDPHGDEWRAANGDIWALQGLILIPGLGGWSDLRKRNG